MLEKPSIQQLENFIVYGKVRNFATAAHMANITQSAFSFQMKKLEEMLGVQLITRSNRGSDLTREGEFFLDRVTNVIHSLDNAIEDLQKFSGKAVSINIGILMSMGDVFMNKHVSYFQKSNANININVYTMEAKTMLKELDEGKIDIASSFLLPQMYLDGYIKKFFHKEEMVFYAPSLKLPGNFISVKQVAKYPLASYSPNYFMNRVINNYFNKYGCKPNIEARLSTPYAIMYYCNDNEVGALLSKRILNELNITEGYYHIDEPLFLDTYLIYKHENPKIKNMEVFVDYVLNTYNKQEQA